MSGFHESLKVLDLDSVLGGLFHESGNSSLSALSISGASSTEFLSYESDQQFIVSQKKEPKEYK